jgi:hypothetical protein
MELSYLSALPRNQRLLLPDGQPVIYEIVVLEAETQEQQP